MFSLDRLTFEPTTDADCEWALALKIAAEKEYIENIFGWDDALQSRLHEEEWSEAKPRKILYQNQAIGSYLLEWREQGYHFGRFFLLPEFHNLGIGSFVLRAVVKTLDSEQQPCTLWVLQGNRAIELYRRFGFEVQREDQHFRYMVRKPIQPT